MSGNTTVDRAEMQKAAGQIDVKTNEMNGVRKDLGGQIGELMTRWQGNASKAFLKAYEEFDGQFDKVGQQLDNIHTKLVGSHSKYVQTEEEQQAASNAITAMLNQ